LINIFSLKVLPGLEFSENVVAFSFLELVSKMKKIKIKGF